MIESHPRAFILGAGLGTRLRPLTANLPKPLVPVRGVPLVSHALRHLHSAGVNEAVINTHHAAGRWAETFPSNSGEGVQLTFRHEPVLLDTGGGLRNVADYFEGQGTFIIYNGDILSSISLEKAWEHHRHSTNLVTLVLRSNASPRHIALGPDGRIVDVRGMLGTHFACEHLFTGIHIVEPEIFSHLPPPGVYPIIPVYLNLIREGHRIGGVVLDEGEWSDLGTPEEYERLR